MWLLLLACCPLWAADVISPVIVTDDRPAGTSATRASEFSGAALTFDKTPLDLASVLASQPSVFAPASGYEAGFHTLQVRGQSGTQNRAFLEGIPLQDNQFSSSAAHWMAPQALGGADFFAEGPPAYFGSDGWGGTLNLKLRAPELTSPRLAVRLGSFGEQRALGQVADASGGWAIAVEAARAREDFAFWNNAGTPFFAHDDFTDVRRHNGWHALSVLPQWQTDWGHGQRARVFGFLTLRGNELPGAVSGVGEGELTTRFGLGAADYRVVAGNTEWTLQAYYLRLTQIFQGPRAAFRSFLLNESDGQTAGARAAFVRAGKWEWEGAAGVQWDHAEQTSDALQSTMGQRAVVPLSWALRRELGRWSWQGALVGQTAFAQARSPSAHFSPRLGVQWEPAAGHRWRAHVGSFFRLPALSESFGSPARVSANPDLRPEYAWKAELGWDSSWGPVDRRVQASLTFSAAWMRDAIVLAADSVGAYRYANIQASRVVYAEAATRWNLARGWSCAGSASWVQAVDASVSIYAGRTLPFRPQLRTQAELTWNPGRWAVGYRWRFHGGFFSDPANAQWTGSASQHGVHVAWRPHGWGMFSLDLINLTDSAAVSSSEWGYVLTQNASGLSGFPVPGRRVVVAWQSDL